LNHRVYRWIKDYEDNGEEALFYKKRKGRKRKVDERLINVQEGKIIREAYIQEKFQANIY
jgi:transposase